MDVWAFKRKALGNPHGNELFHGNQHLLQIYHAQPDHAPHHAQPNGHSPICMEDDLVANIALAVALIALVAER